MARVRAPELRGRGWLNTGGQALSIKDLRGRILILDFWTFCCVNCLHVLDELRPLEEKYADVLRVIGVHSPKFEHEKDPAALALAVERYGITHPVLDDPTLDMWQRYTARAWPTLCVIDPEGYVVASMAGEGHASGIASLIEELIGEHEAKGALRRGDRAHATPSGPPAGLRFPGKAVPVGNHFLVADSANHSLVELDGDGRTELRRIGTGARGRLDGPPTAARFNEPAGICQVPADVAVRAGYDVVVADTVNHLLRGVRLDTGAVSTVAGTGRPWRSRSADPDQGAANPTQRDALTCDLSSPWDVAWFDGRIIVAMAGIHQLWWFDPVNRTAGGYAGTTVEALRDGPLAEAWFAQPSGLSTSADDRRLWIADAESSALRWVEDGLVHTAVGQGLFDFGHVDGPASEALFQHPLGVLAMPDGSVLVADTYNGAVRRYHDGGVNTVATNLAEPSDLLRTPAGEIVVVESAAHRLTRLSPNALTADPHEARLPAGGSAASGMRMRTERPPTHLNPGSVTLEVIFDPAPGQKLDDAYGSPVRLAVSAAPENLLSLGGGTSTSLVRQLSVTLGTGVLQVTAQAATCDTEATNPACHLTRQDWGIPIVVSEGGQTRLALVLRGIDS